MSTSTAAGDARYVLTCPVGCTAPFAATELALPEGPLLRCPECGQLVSQVGAARYWETMAQFDAADFNQPAGRELARRNAVARRRLGRIAKLLGKPPHAIRLLDVGCSRGQFVAAAAALGFAAEGVEPAPRIAAAARAAGLTVHAGLLEEQRFPDATFDALTLFEVLEHLREPAGLLRECRRVLKPGGVLLASTGNAASWTVAVMGARWDYFHIAKDGGHISFFNPHSIALLARRCGLEVARIDTARVKFHEKAGTPRARYAAGKLAAELLNLPARLAGRGHDMLAWLRRPA
jgi:2-polyprenyl-3-methyl-5-hydroxy-6-metoxy-1,4-benzoquinol methylase